VGSTSKLISGDEGRTEPSLAGLLGVGAEVTALDVVAVEGEDEPFEREEFFGSDGPGVTAPTSGAGPTGFIRRTSDDRA